MSKEPTDKELEANIMKVMEKMGFWSPATTTWVVPADLAEEMGVKLPEEDE